MHWLVVLMAGVAAYLYVQLEASSAELNDALSRISGMEAQLQIERERRTVESEIMKGGDDETLSDYGADVARKLWPSP